LEFRYADIPNSKGKNSKETSRTISKFQSSETFEFGNWNFDIRIFQIPKAKIPRKLREQFPGSKVQKLLNLEFGISLEFLSLDFGISIGRV
jgi:hypothetical protein